MRTVEETTRKQLNSTAAGPPNGKEHLPLRETAFGCPRDFLDNRFVYAVVSARARGLSLGVNMNPDKRCNFDCLYCEVDRRSPPRETKLDVNAMAAELHKTLAFVLAGKLHGRLGYSTLSRELLTLRHVALSGDGEPTLAPNFAEAVQAVVHVRALGEFPFFKIVLITNATGLDQSQVQQGLKQLTRSDEIWAKLDGGTQAFLQKVDRPNVPLEKVLANILLVGRQRPVVIQSLFPAINGEEPPAREIEEYAQRLKELKAAGADISLVQIYSAMRPMFHAECGHLPLKTLSHIAQTVRQVASLKAEVF
jgi:wyosine [tRNA(Phe)-imidazoG37] synthetase (radical SAM superfamily)